MAAAIRIEVVSLPWPFAIACAVSDTALFDACLLVIMDDVIFYHKVRASDCLLSSNEGVAHVKMRWLAAKRPSDAKPGE